MLTRKPINTDPIHTTSASVLLHPRPRPCHIARVINLPDQRVRLPHPHTFPHYLAHHNATPSILASVVSVIASATISPPPPTHSTSHQIHHSHRDPFPKVGAF
jgi:hypothetical protein